MNQMEMDLLPPKLSIDFDIELKLTIIAGILNEITKACGVNIAEALQKGIIDRDVIKRITISFHSAPKKIEGQIIIEIDWEKFEFLAKTDKGDILFKNVDINKNICNQLDKALYDFLKCYVARIKEKHNITDVVVRYHYRDKYYKNVAATRKYMNMVPVEDDIEYAQNVEFDNDLSVIMQGTCGIITTIFKAP